MKNHTGNASDVAPRSSSISSTVLEGLRVRDQEAWNKLVAIFGPVVYGWCRERGLQPDDAADIVQKVFQSVLAHLEKFHRSKAGGTFRGWLWMITQNKVRDHFRRRAGRPEAIGGTNAKGLIEQLPEPDAAGSDEPSSVDSRGLITSGVLNSIRSNFGESAWQAFWQMTVDGRSSADVAADLGMTKDAVRQAKCRVLRRLREEREGLM